MKGQNSIRTVKSILENQFIVDWDNITDLSPDEKYIMVIMYPFEVYASKVM